MDPIQIGTTVAIVLDGIKKAREVSKRTKDADTLAVLLDAQEAALELKEELLNVRAENIGLKEKLTLRETMAFDRGAHWKEGEHRDGPFCSRCLEADGKAIRLTPGYGQNHGCPECKNNFEVTSATRGRDFPLPISSARL